MSDSNRKISEALELLNEAAKDKKEELRELLEGRYEHVKEAFQEATEAGKDNFDRARRFTAEAWEGGEEKVREFASHVDKDVHKNPWAYIGGAAVVTLLLGFILGSSNKKD
jgi:ElaB/YqjD/DUF883 family membrane-anchored ribosome-binding protein